MIARGRRVSNGQWAGVALPAAHLSGEQGEARDVALEHVR